MFFSFAGHSLRQGEDGDDLYGVNMIRPGSSSMQCATYYLFGPSDLSRCVGTIFTFLLHVLCFLGLNSVAKSVLKVVGSYYFAALSGSVRPFPTQQ